MEEKCLACDFVRYLAENLRFRAYGWGFRA